MKKCICLILVLTLALSCCASAEEFYSSWSQWPVANGDVKVSIVIPMNSGYGVPAEKTWFWPFFEEATGIDFEITQIMDEAVSEQKNLMYASGELPDVMLGISHSTSDLVMYGDEEGLLLDMKPWVNADVMPNLMQLVEYYPDIMSYITTPSGSIYTQCWVWDFKFTTNTPTFISETRMAEAGVTAVPQTLDDFTAMLYAMKETVGDESFVPLGGSWSAYSPIYYILNAMGFVSDGYNNGTSVSVRDGKAVIPATDPVFYEALKLLKQYYTDGILDPDFFSIDNTIVEAKCAEDKLGVYPGSPKSTRPTDKEWCESWSSVTALTSEWNDTKAWKGPNPITIGGFVMSSKCENPEIILRAFDALYSFEGFFLAWEGPIVGTEFGDAQKVGGRAYYYGEDGNSYNKFVDADGNEIDGNTYRYSVSIGSTGIGNDEVWFKDPEHKADFNYPYYELDLEPVRNGFTFESYEGDKVIYVDSSSEWRCSIYYYLADYYVTGYPNVTYYSPDDTMRIDELRSVLKPYIESAIGQFIVGDRPLDEEEFGKYIGELESLGASELNAIYDKYYQNYLANLG